MPHDIVRNHHTFAWDMDETLVNGPHSPFWRECVKARPDALHYIVTFREKIDTLTIWDELSSVSLFPLHRDQFQGILYLPDRVRIPFDSMPSALRAANIHSEPTDKVRRILNTYRYDWEDVKDRHRAFSHWKASACKEVGATVIVDDLEDLVKPGCDHFGIQFVHALEK